MSDSNDYQMKNRKSIVVKLNNMDLHKEIKNKINLHERKNQNENQYEDQTVNEES